jgi:hypothetical protein
MSLSTAVDVGLIEAQASKHEQFGQDISSQLDTLKANVEGVLSKSSSEATKALHISTETWVENVKKTVIEHMNAMAANIRKAAGDSSAQDETSMKQLLDVPLETGIFLGGSK